MHREQFICYYIRGHSWGAAEGNVTPMSVTAPPQAPCTNKAALGQDTTSPNVKQAGGSVRITPVLISYCIQTYLKKKVHT